MAVRRQNNLISQQRVDVPQMRSIESAVSSDFDELLRGWVIGDKGGFVLRGMEIAMAGSIGGAASGLSLLVADSSIWHGTSAQAGTFFVVPSGTPAQPLSSAINSRVDGAFVASAINYVGIEYEREPDDSTSGQVYLWNPTTASETTKTVPLAKTLDYRIKITTSVWAASVLPIATVTTDAAGNVTSIEDRRPMLFRLGTAGRQTPNPFYVYPWSNHSEGRLENNPSSSSSSINPFRGGDKGIYTEREWKEVVMSLFLEINGGTYWYSQGTGGSTGSIRKDLGLTVFTGQGLVSHDQTTAGQMNWSQNVYAKLIGSRLTYRFDANAAGGNVILADDEVAYVNLVRDADVLPNLVFTNGSPTVASVGAVSWTTGLVAGDYIKVGSLGDEGYYQILSVDSLSQVTLTQNYGDTSTGASGAKAKYAYGVYMAVAVPSTDRHIFIDSREDVSFDKDVMWLFLRSDNGGSPARVYAHFSGTEIQQGDDVEIGDGFGTDNITYIGALSETDNSPIFSDKLGVLATEVTDVTTPAAASITTGQYFTINAANDAAQYYVWYNKDAGGGNPAPSGRIPIEVAISTGDTASQVAGFTQAAINAVADFGASVLGSVVTVTNALAGSTTDAVNVDVSGLSILVTTQGSGTPNFVVVDGENLTLSIKRLDATLAGVINATDNLDYEEYLEVVAGAPADDNEVTGPISAPFTIDIPFDSRNSEAVFAYKVGYGQLQVFLNGQKIHLGLDWDEVGSYGTDSSQIQTLIDLEVGDLLAFRVDPSLTFGGSGGGAGEANTASNVGSGDGWFKTKVGVDLQFKSIVAGAGVVITPGANDITISSTPSTALDDVDSATDSNATLTSANDSFFMDGLTADRTVTLPSAVGLDGKRFNIKAITLNGFTMYIASVLSQTIDNVNATSTPLAVTSDMENVTLIAWNGNWWRQ